MPKPISVWALVKSKIVLAVIIALTSAAAECTA